MSSKDYKDILKNRFERMQSNENTEDEILLPIGCNLSFFSNGKQRKILKENQEDIKCLFWRSTLDHSIIFNREYSDLVSENQLNLFIGDLGQGKSTILKLIEEQLWQSEADDKQKQQKLIPLHFTFTNHKLVEELDIYHLLQQEEQQFSSFQIDQLKLDLQQRNIKLVTLIDNFDYLILNFSCQKIQQFLETLIFSMKSIYI